jgi:hypothetical protein
MKDKNIYCCLILLPDIVESVRIDKATHTSGVFLLVTKARPLPLNLLSFADASGNCVYPITLFEEYCSTMDSLRIL